MHKFKKMTTFGACVVVLAVVTAGCGGSSSSSSSSDGVTDTEILLGGSTPLSGPVASSCKPVTDGSMAWFESVNAEGGVNGRKINWDLLDDAYDLARAGANAKKLVGDDVFAMFGGCGSLQPPAVLPQLQKAGIPYLWPTAQIAGIYTPPTEGNFGFSPSYPSYFRALVPTILEKEGVGSVAVVLHQAAGMEEGEQVIEEETENAGGEYLGGEIIPTATADFTPYILQLKKLKPDYVVNSLPQAAGAKFLQTALDQGFAPNKKYLNVLSWAGGQVIDPFATGPDSNTFDDKIVVAHQVEAADEPANAECVAAIEKYAPDVVIGLDAMLGCNSAQWLTTALGMIDGEPTREKLNELLEGMEDEQLSPGTAPVTMSSDDHLTTSGIFLFELQEGRYVKTDTIPVDGSE